MQDSETRIKNLQELEFAVFCIENIAERFICIPRARSISWAGISLDAALRFFYYSDVYCLMREGVSDLHCMSDAYLEEELEMEYQLKGSLFPLHRQISRSIETLIFSLTNGFRGSMIISNDNFI